LLTRSPVYIFLAGGEGGSYDKLGELSAAVAGLRRHLEPPLPLSLARAFVAKAVAANQLAFATVIAPGFHGLLPAGELMALRFKHLQFNAQCGVGHQPSMQQSWSALRLSRGDCGARCPHFTTAGYLGVRAKTSPRRPCLAKDISVVQARIQAHVRFFWYHFSTIQALFPPQGRSNVSFASGNAARVYPP
jgi:hypothetical protein